MAEMVSERHARELTERTESLGIEPFYGGAKDRWVRIIAHAVSGRRIGPDDFGAPLDVRGYL